MKNNKISPIYETFIDEAAERVKEQVTNVFAADELVDLSSVVRAISLGVSPDLADSFGRTPLMAIAAFGTINNLNRVLLFRPNVNKVDRGGFRAIDYAAQRDNKEFLAILSRFSTPSVVVSEASASGCFPKFNLFR